MKESNSVTRGSLPKAIVAFALPLAATGILQQLFNAADVAVVGRFTGDAGKACMAAVGANTPIIGLIVNSFVAISMGSNVVIANAVGRQSEKDASRAAHTSIAFALIAGFVLLILAQLVAEPVFKSQKLPEEVIPMALLYFRLYVSGLPVILLYNFEAAIFRSTGDTRTPLIALMLSGFINVLLNITLVVGFKRTVDGVAIATVLSNAVSCVILGYLLLKGNTRIKMDIKQLKIDPRMLKKILAIGIPAGLQSMVFSAANIIIQAAINSLGTVVLAASSAAFNLEVFAYQVFNSFAQATTTFVGQNFGAGQIKRCKQSMFISLIEGGVALGASIALILGFGRPILFLFNDDPAVIEVGYQRLIIIFSAYFFSMTYEIVSGYLRGFGISVIPAIITMICVCGIRISWIYWVFPLEKTFNRIMLVYPISLASTAVAMVIAALILHPGAKHEKKAAAA
ncbi:MAG: MATE family efflux transporter [Lachnospiraceae bacterium]|nr:MATE family efflux transporter [Lachnospiraceae bacterium]